MGWVGWVWCGCVVSPCTNCPPYIRIIIAHIHTQSPPCLSCTPSGGSSHGGVGVSSSSPPVLLNAACCKSREGGEQREGEGEELGGLYERVAKLALDHHAAFEMEAEEGDEGAVVDGGEELGEEEDEAAAAPFPTLAEGHSR